MPYSDSPSLRLRRLSLTSPPPISRRLILPQAHGQIFHPPTACRMTVSCSFSLPCMGFFFTFPSRYFFTIGHPGVFSLTRWSSPIHTGFHVPHATRDKGPGFLFHCSHATHFSDTGLSPSMVQDSAASLIRVESYPLSWIDPSFMGNHDRPLPTTPTSTTGGRFRLFPLRSPLLRESLLLSSPPATKMFQFTGFSLFLL